MGQAAHHHSVAQVALASVGETDHRKLKWFAISCLARSTTSAAIVVSTARPDERNGGLDFRHLVKLSRSSFTGGTLAPESIMIIWEDRLSHFSLTITELTCSAP